MPCISSYVSVRMIWLWAKNPNVVANVQISFANDAKNIIEMQIVFKKCIDTCIIPIMLWF